MTVAHVILRECASGCRKAAGHVARPRDPAHSAACSSRTAPRGPRQKAEGAARKSGGPPRSASGHPPVGRPTHIRGGAAPRRAACTSITQMRWRSAARMRRVVPLLLRAPSRVVPPATCWRSITVGDTDAPTHRRAGEGALPLESAFRPVGRQAALQEGLAASHTASRAAPEVPKPSCCIKTWTYPSHSLVGEQVEPTQWNVI